MKKAMEATHRGTTSAAGSARTTWRAIRWSTLWVAMTGVGAAVAGANVPFGDQHVVTTAASLANDVYAGDLDGDGDLDLVSASQSGSIAWYENDGAHDPGFTRVVLFGAAFGAFSVHAGDLDGDGDLDLMSASSNDDTIAWYENDGAADPSFTRIVISTAADGARSVYAADLDGDGDLDLVSASTNDNEIAWYENDGASDPTFVRIVISTAADAARSVFAGDVDGDGDVDLVSASFVDNEVAWYENDGAADPSFARFVISTESSGATSVSMGDVDGDGDLDILSASLLDDEIAWYENDGASDPSFSRIVISTEADSPTSAAAADLDGDGDLDIVSASSMDDTIAWYENDGNADPGFTRFVTSTAADNARAVLTGDVDGDGDLDLLSASFQDGKIAWYENETIHRSARFPDRTVISTASIGASSVLAGDVDGDGDLDLMSTSLSDNEIAWYENDGTADPSFTRFVISNEAGGALSLHAGDVDGDGDLDLLSASLLDDEIAWYENDGAVDPTFTRFVISNEAHSARSVHAGDLDGDGDLDLLSASFADDEIAWYENDGAVDPTFTRFVISTEGNGAVAVHACDVDGDGDLDLLSASILDDEIAWFENDGADDPSFARFVISTDANGARAVHAGDLDGDGDLDLLSASGNDDEIAWYENDGADDPTFNRFVISTASDNPYSVHVGDLDGDGDLDLMSASFNDDAVAWYENDGADDPSFLRFVVSTDADGATAVHGADIDGDGDLDLVSASQIDHEIGWYPNRGGQFSLPTADVAPVRVEPDAAVAALEIGALHRGRTGDPDVELVTFELQLEDGAGNALSDPQVDALLDEVAVYLDDGSGAFELGTDTEVTAISSFALNAGTLTVSFPDGDANVQIPFLPPKLPLVAPKTYFVVLDFAGDAAMQTPDEIRVVHRTEASSTGEDADHDLPVVLEYATDVASAVIEVNDAPEALDDFVDLLEDDNGFSSNVLDGSADGPDRDEELDPLTAELVSGPSHGTLVGGLGSDGSFTYLPDPDFNGDDSFDYAANDGLADSNTATVWITVVEVNDPPSFDLTNPVTVERNLGAQSVPEVAFNVLAGPPDEAHQLLTFQIVGNTDPGLFSAGPALDGNGTLTLTPAAGVLGTATITVELMDDGGNANGGIDTSGIQAFDIEIVDTLRPEVSAISSLPGGAIDTCVEVGVEIASLVVAFSEAMADPAGDGAPEDVTNPANYQLIASGGDHDVDTTTCGPPLGDDLLVAVASVTFDTGSNEATIDFASGLADGAYRLMVCDALEDTNGNALAQDFVVTFRQDERNELVNGAIDCDLGGWMAFSTVGTEIQYASEDIDDATISGSARVLQLSSSTDFSLAQCLPLVPLRRYTLGASVRVDVATDDLELQRFCVYASDPGCVDPGPAMAVFSDPLTATGDAWIEISDRLTTPVDVASALCTVNVDTAAGGTFDLYLDQLRLEPFDLFTDGFESGDTSAWSSVTP